MQNAKTRRIPLGISQYDTDLVVDRRKNDRGDKLIDSLHHENVFMINCCFQQESPTKMDVGKTLKNKKQIHLVSNGN